MIKQLIVFLFLLPFVSANVVINQVLYDPVGTEAGGEAIELKNAGSLPVDISDWVIATASSDKDAVIPKNTILAPGSSFLIADEGWNDKKDDKSWRSADYEEKLTIGNSDSGIALLDNDSVVDAVGWGDAEAGLFTGSSAQQVAAGMALLRIQDTKDNSRDFVESVPDFREGIAVPVTADVSVSFPEIEVSSSLKLSPVGNLVIKNNGDSAVNIKLMFGDFHYKNNTISRSAVSINSPLEFTIQPNSEYSSSVRLNPPANLIPGKYASVLRVVIVEES